MWTAKIKTITKEGGRLTLTIEYTNGIETLSEPITVGATVDLSWLKNRIRTRINNIQGIYDFADTLAIDQVIDTTAPVVNQTSIDKDQFSANVQKLQFLKLAVDLGILTGSETIMTNLRNKLKTDFKPEYLN